MLMLVRDGEYYDAARFGVKGLGFRVVGSST